MKCFELEISEFIDKELSPAKQKDLFNHMAECVECRELFLNELNSKKILFDHFNSLKLPVAKPKIGTKLYYYAAAAVLLILFSTMFVSQGVQYQRAIYKLETKIDSLLSDKPVLLAENKNLSQNNLSQNNKNNNIQEIKKNFIKPTKNIIKKKYTLNRYQLVVTAKISNEDFLSTQLSGN